MRRTFVKACITVPRPKFCGTASKPAGHRTARGLQSLHLLLIGIYQQGIFLGLQNLLSACHSIDPAVEAARLTVFMLYVPEITSLPVLQS